MRSIGMALFTGAVAIILGVGIAAQAKPDFSGKWTLIPDPNAAAAGGGGGGRGGGGRGGGGGGQFCGQECTITQDATTLSITRTTPGGEVKASYKLDGSDSKNMQAGRGGEQTEVISKAMWEGDKITISRTQDFGGNSVTIKQTLSITGGEMTVATEGGRGGGAPQRYKKN